MKEKKQKQKQSKDSLGDRMKGYEKISKTYLIHRMPTIIRLDGKAFHTFTKGMNKPFDEVLTKTMHETMLYLCENIQGTVLGYTQSDEITLVLVDYKEYNTCAWFDGNVQKQVSVAASMATMKFNELFVENAEEYIRGRFLTGYIIPEDLEIYRSKYYKAMFDARAFNVPKEDVCNCLIWRQKDAIRNSIQSLGQANFSHKELHKKTSAQIKDMLLDLYINWDDLEEYKQRGSCAVKGSSESEKISGWKVEAAPVFTENRSYIEDRILLFSV